MKKEIKIGYIYKNKWGDIRVPIFIKNDVVSYIEKRNENTIWFYNPYMNTVVKSNFLSKLELVEISNPLKLKEITKMIKLIEIADKNWSNLLVKTGKEINKVLLKVN